MKKILLLLFLFFLIPTVYASSSIKYLLENNQIEIINSNSNEIIKMVKSNNKKNTNNDSNDISPTDWGKVEDTDLETICSKPELRKPLKFIGTIISILKIAIPILIIIFGIIDLFKAIPNSKDDRIMVAIKSIGVRFIAGVFIFFIPGIIQLILDWVNEWSNYQNTWCCCTQCILDSGKCDVNSCSSDSCKIGGMN